MPQCLICKNAYEPFISFGEMPIANGFLNKEEFDNEYFFELKVGYCGHCHMVQLAEQPAREMMFHKNYAFYSSTSTQQILHFKELSEMVVEKFLLSDDPFIVELGSNDGIMLQNFAYKNIRHLGVEPSSNVAQVAIAKGVNSISEFFDKSLAEKIVQDNGKADVILAANVMCHIPYLHSVFDGVKILLNPTGAFIFEDPYLGDILEKISYDQIYDEHAFYFSIASISYIAEQHEMELFDVEHLDVHGGSMRYYIGHKGVTPIFDAVRKQQDAEVQLGLQAPETFDKFRTSVEASRDALVELLTDIRNSKGETIVGYGATSKSTTIANYCGIGPELVEYISDTTPLKQGKFSPGTHIPVRPYEYFSNNLPRYALLFAWNHAKEIMEKETIFKDKGGKWIVYTPKVGVIDDSL